MNDPTVHHVAVIGGGVAGLTAADRLAARGMQVSLFERRPFAGGHAINLACKATVACVKCGACLAEEALQQTSTRETVEILCGAQIETISPGPPFALAYRFHHPLVAADRCDGCGLCLERCPVPGAIMQGRAVREGSWVAIHPELCRNFNDAACHLCQEICPQNAIHLADTPRAGHREVDAIVVASGFSPYNPSEKPYGYGRFPDVITSLEAEGMLRANPVITRPSNGRPVRNMAFVQCVGSRDASMGHNWCSAICCGSSMRMARLIQSRRPDVEISFFYIDLQTFGRDFPVFAQQSREKIRMVRAIPGEIVQAGDDRLALSVFDPQKRASLEESFDMVVLSVGLTPDGNRSLAGILNVSLKDDGFWPVMEEGAKCVSEGIVSAGTAQGPMGIAQSIASAEQAAWALDGYLKSKQRRPAR